MGTRGGETRDTENTGLTSMFWQYCASHAMKLTLIELNFILFY